jgi:hypothetical protein
MVEWPAPFFCWHSVDKLQSASKVPVHNVDKTLTKTISQMPYQNHELHKLDDGSILLYTRNGSPVFHARVKLDGVRGYPKIGSTGKRSKVDAYVVAKGWLDGLRYKARHGLEVRSYDFDAGWREWGAATLPALSAHRSRVLEGSANRYFLPFFGDRNADTINDNIVREYWDWRVNFWSSPAGQELIANARKSRATSRKPYKQTLGNVATVPSPKTLQMEQDALRQVFNWLHRWGFINRVPEIKAPRPKARSRETGRRPAFDAKEWSKLQNFLLRWVEALGDGKKHRVHSLHRFQRRMIRAYILFMRYSGLGPGEAARLRWRDILLVTDKQGDNKVALNISPETKTGWWRITPATG